MTEFPETPVPGLTMDTTATTDFTTTRKRIYVGGLHEETTEDLLCSLFGQFGRIRNCKILDDASGFGNKYAFIDYDEHEGGSMAICAMDGRVCLGNTIKVNWATNNTSPYEELDNINSKDYAIFVGDISELVTESELLNAFSKFGHLSGCRIIRDPVTFKCKNFGFIYFREKDAAENAIKTMNGYWIGNRSIRTNWAQRKILQANYNRNPKKITYKEVATLASPTNSTVFCGNFKRGITESLLNSMFSRFGTIVGIRVFVDKGYGFVTYANKSSAVRAIMEMNSFVTSDGSAIKVSWGKERSVVTHLDVNPPLSYGEPLQQYESATAYWQYMQNCQQKYAMLMQPQNNNFYQNNTVLTPASSSCPFYPGGNANQLFHTSSVSEPRMHLHKPQATRYFE